MTTEVSTADEAAGAPKFPVKLEDMVDQYIRLRDTLKKADDAHKAKTEPAREYLEQLNAALLAKLQEVGTENAKTIHGTVYRTVRKSATVADGATFRQFVINTEQFDLVDWRANANAVSDFIDTVGKGNPPPGVNYSTIVQAGVRRPG